MRFFATGRVHPERADIHFSSIPFQTSDNGRVTVRCDSSQLSILLELPELDGWNSACLAAEHYSTIIVGALGFSLGSGYSVEIIQVIEENGTPHVFGVRPTGKSPEETLGFNPHQTIFNRALHLAVENLFFRLALRDFLRAINDTTDCAFYCYRVIESIKSSFIFQTGIDDWQTMHTNLGTDKETIERVVKTYADPVRHGNWVEAKSTDSSIRWKMLSFTRDILSKYLDYAKPAV
jgi:hypothetical protein